jgi:ferritin-like protein
MSRSYHESTTELSAETRSLHRALISLIEELDAIDWYQQRIDVEGDEELRAILAHNRDEEVEHAAMALEWLRRRVPKFDETLRTYLFTSGSITAIEEGADGASETHASPQAGADGGDLGIGKLSSG